MGETGEAGAQASATTMVANSNTSNRGSSSKCTPGSSSSSHTPRGSDSSHNSRPHGSSSGDIRSHSGDHGNSSSTPGPAGRDHPHNSSTGAERPISRDNSIWEISRTGSDTCVSGAARRSISPQSAEKLRPHQRRSIVRTRHHLFRELMPRSAFPWWRIREQK